MIRRSCNDLLNCPFPITGSLFSKRRIANYVTMNTMPLTNKLIANCSALYKYYAANHRHFMPYFCPNA